MLSTVQGHLHTQAYTEYTVGRRFKIFGTQVGCGIDFDSYAMAYAKNFKKQAIGCAVILGVAHQLKEITIRPTVHIVFSVQEEFNLRGVLPVAQTLKPDIAIQIDLMLASDTPDMKDQGEVSLGGGPCMSLYSFHGRGTLNGSSSTLTRNTILSSSNSDSAVDFSAGTKEVFCTLPAKETPSPVMNATKYVTTHNSTISETQTMDSGVLAGPVTVTGSLTITGNLFIL